MASSIRWRLQLGTSVLLLTVVGGFAGLLYADARSARDREIDADLTAAANYLDSALRGWPPFELDPNFPPKGFGKERDRPPKGGKEKDRPPKDGFFPPRERPTLERLQAGLVPPGWLEQPTGDRYFGVWREDGSLVYGFGRTAEVPPARPTSRDFSLVAVPAGYEGAMSGPHRCAIVVGASTLRSDQVLTRYALRLTLTGAGVMLVGLAGSWWLASRIVTPLAAITATAARISADNLTERIDAGRVDRELAELAEVLNGTFARLEAAFAQLARFTADASHELRTPLAVLRSNAELALSRPRSANEYRDALATGLSAATRMTGIVDGLLTLARAEAGQADAIRMVVDLGKLSAEVAEQLAPVAQEYGVKLDVQADVARTRGDDVALGRVVANLIENAIRYNRPGGNVRVSVTSTEGVVNLTVEDTGVGIAAEHLPHLFERFYRVDVARARSSGGTGLGLAICKSIVSAHGGEIAVTSTPGQGSVFLVQLPLAARGGDRPKA